MITHRACPECGGSDRYYLIAHPHNGGAPHWRCRVCDHTERYEDGDEGTSQPQARRTLTPEETAQAHYAYTIVAERCAAALWTPAGHAALTYLRRRGYSDATIREARLGWCGSGERLMTQLFYESKTAYEGARVGGLRKTQARPRPVIVGTITIPYFDGATCVLLRGRKLAPRPGEPKYYSPAGPLYASAVPRFYLHEVIEGARSVIVTEGELKALAAHQEWRAGRVDMPTVATCGVDYLPPALIAALQGKAVYLCYDNEMPNRGNRASPADLAMRRNGAKLQAAGIAVKVMQLPRPDSVVKVDLDSFIFAQHEVSL